MRLPRSCLASTPAVSRVRLSAVPPLALKVHARAPIASRTALESAELRARRAAFPDCERSTFTQQPREVSCVRIDTPRCPRSRKPRVRAGGLVGAWNTVAPCAYMYVARSSSQRNSSSEIAAATEEELQQTARESARIRDVIAQNRMCASDAELRRDPHLHAYVVLASRISRARTR